MCRHSHRQDAGATHLDGDDPGLAPGHPPFVHLLMQLGIRSVREIHGEAPAISGVAEVGANAACGPDRRLGGAESSA